MFSNNLDVYSTVVLSPSCRTVAQQQVYEMTCELSIDASLLERQQAIPYKYVIYSPRMVEDNDCWEYLHGVSGQGIVNRCLIIPTKEFKRSSSGGKTMHVSQM